MIVSASYKTDIPAFYGRWFMNRLAAGFARVENAYGGPPFEVSLARQDVDGFVFWTRNAGPFLDALERVRAQGFPFVVQFTALGYDDALEPGVVAADAAVAQIKTISSRFGARAAVWRYDPVLLSALTPPAWHEANFARLARALAGAVDEVVLSFAQIYRKSARNLDRAAAEHGFAWRDPDADEKRALLARLAAIAAGHGLRATLCAQPELLAEGLQDAACIDANRLADVAGRQIDAPRRPHRDGCGCWASKDIGAYESCPQGCAYCYAVGSREKAKRALGTHDERGDFLIAPRRAAAVR